MDTNLLDPDPDVFPLLELSRVVGSPSDRLVFMVEHDSLPFTDGRWHNVVWTWKVTLPLMVACCVDGREIDVFRITPIDSFTGFSIDFDQVDQWNIEVRSCRCPKILHRRLAELFMQIEDDYNDPVFSLLNSTESTPFGTILVGGKGFRTPDNFAMDLGTTGEDALAISHNKPQIFCSGDESPPQPSALFAITSPAITFAVQRDGVPQRATSDPFLGPDRSRFVRRSAVVSRSLTLRSMLRGHDGSSVLLVYSGPNAVDGATRDDHPPVQALPGRDEVHPRRW